MSCEDLQGAADAYDSRARRRILFDDLETLDEWQKETSFMHYCPDASSSQTTDDSIAERQPAHDQGSQSILKRETPIRGWT